jgi:hypothetical protein
MEERAEAKISMIHFCERVLNRPQTPAQQLIGVPLEELTRLADDLRDQVLKQR